MHSSVAETFLSLTLSAPRCAKQQFPTYRFVQLVTARFDMDQEEAAVFATLSGSTLAALRPNRDVAFDRHLRDVIERHALVSLFCDSAPGRHHHAIRPAGYDYDVDAVDPQGMEKWRADYRAMSTARQLLAASIIWLYRGGKDNVWLRRVPCAWHATEAVDEMRRRDVLSEWGSLVSLYPGW